MALGSPVTSTATIGTGSPGYAQPTSTDSSNSTNGGTNGLYLYTFLITLLVLLSVASLIIVRSCILRRRFRRQMRLALESGGGGLGFVFPPPQHHHAATTDGGIPLVLAGVHHHARRRKKTVLGKKPVMWEIWMEKEKVGRRDESGLEMRTSTLIQPISSTLVRPTLPSSTTSTQSTTSPPADTPSTILLTRETAQEYFGIDMRSFREVVHDHWRNTRSVVTGGRRPRATTTGDAATPVTRPVSQRMNSSSPDTPNDTKDEEKKLVIGFLIALPDACRPTYANTSVPPFKIDLDEQAGPVSEKSFLYSPEELERGKMKALVVDDDGFQFGFREDVELPPVLLGVLDVDWTGREGLVPSLKMPVAEVSTNQAGDVGVGAVV